MTLREQLHQVIEEMQLGTASDPESMAEVFCEWDDDTQAQFFVHVARIMQTWKVADPIGAQGYYIGRHLRTCSCSTPEACDLIAAIARGASHEI